MEFILTYRWVFLILIACSSSIFALTFSLFKNYLAVKKPKYCVIIDSESIENPVMFQDFSTAKSYCTTKNSLSTLSCKRYLLTLVYD